MTDNPLTHTQPIQESDSKRLREVLNILREVYTIEQLEQIAMASRRMQASAITRRAQAYLKIKISDKGYPFVIETTESQRFADSRIHSPRVS